MNSECRLISRAATEEASNKLKLAGATTVVSPYVAAGRSDGFWHRNLNYWDIAAGIILVKEAGGFVNDFSGDDKYVENENILVTNANISKEMIEILSN